jgi:hypothetical protein
MPFVPFLLEQKPFAPELFDQRTLASESILWSRVVRSKAIRTKVVRTKAICTDVEASYRKNAKLANPLYPAGHTLLNQRRCALTKSLQRWMDSACRILKQALLVNAIILFCLHRKIFSFAFPGIRERRKTAQSCYFFSISSLNTTHVGTYVGTV